MVGLLFANPFSRCTPCFDGAKPALRPLLGYETAHNTADPPLECPNEVGSKWGEGIGSRLGLGHRKGSSLVREFTEISRQIENALSWRIARRTERNFRVEVGAVRLPCNIWRN